VARDGEDGGRREGRVSANKERVDLALVGRGLAESRAKAQALVMAGVVFAGERRVEKPGQLIAKDQGLEVRGAAHPWVSRGGLKLERALEHFAIDPSGAVCLDIGASTGGPGDCAATRASSCWRRRTPAI
jgi:23S rRNA (cytidine1920-2'-O)/16S rRNA (cytidine1409-2'-O)-methyltransferase